MDRLTKKCFLGSGIVHGTLVLLLIVGPALMPSDSSKVDQSQILTVIPDVALSSGATVMGFGTPNGGKADPTPPPKVQVVEPKPPVPPPVTRVEPPKDKPVTPPKTNDRDIKDAPKNPTRDPDALESNKSKKPLVDVKNLVVRDPSKTKPTANKTADTTAADESRARAEAKRRADIINAAAGSIRSGASTGVEVGPVGLPTGSGPSVGAFGDILRTIYFNNWHEPSDATSEDAVVRVTVTIARDGSVISGRITKSSGDPAVDRTVEQTLRNVTYVKPFPADWKESQRQFQLNFSLKAKRSQG
ncbi:MAG: TonB terminal [Verrucomicrobiota bacterium]|jgi:TonB family protein